MYTFIGDDVIRSSHVCVRARACEERLRLAYRKVAAPDQGRHYFATPRNEKFLPSHWTNLYRYSSVPRSLTGVEFLRFSFIADILEPSNESPLIFLYRFLVHDPERKESFVTARIRRFMNGSLTYFIALLS